MSKYNPVKLKKNNGREKKIRNPKNYKRKEYLQLNDRQLDTQKTFHQKQYWPEKKSKIFRMN